MHTGSGRVFQRQTRYLENNLHQRLELKTVPMLSLPSLAAPPTATWTTGRLFPFLALTCVLMHNNSENNYCSFAALGWHTWKIKMILKKKEEKK